jgi:hypothetical protein
MRDCNGTPIERGQQVEELVTGYAYDVCSVEADEMLLKMEGVDSLYPVRVPTADGALFLVSSEEDNEL